MSTSTKLIELEIFRFLGSTAPETLCIRGKWGVGKTFSWKYFLKEAHERKKIKAERYAYVSLFGLNSLDELKFSIFQNTVKGDQATSSPDFNTLQSALDSIEGLGRKSAWLVNLVPPLRSIFAGAGPAFFLAVRNQIVCIDDLERKGEKLSIGDVLGLCSFLKEERNCKVVLLLNEEAFEDGVRKQFQKYFEKVVDSAVEFAPSAEECAAIALDKNSKFYDAVRKNCIALGISNIRIIKKIERLAFNLERILRPFDTQVINSGLKTLTLAAWATFSRDVAPTKEFLLHKRRSSFFGLSKDEEQQLTESEKNWNALLNAYEFSHFDELDFEILEGVERGFFDEQEIVEKARPLHHQVITSAAHASLQEAWASYHASFEDNSDVVATSVFEGCKANIKFLSPNSLDTAVRLLKDLKKSAQAAELIEVYAVSRSDEKALFDMDRNPFFGDMRDPDVLRLFKEKKAALVPVREPKEILQRIYRNSWGSADIDVLNQLTADDFYNLFKAERGDVLFEIVSGALEFRRIGNATPEQRSICEKATEALVRIGSENPLNRRRVQKYGIKID